MVRPRESNPRPPALQSNALTTFRHILLIVQEQNVYEITFHVKPNAMTERLKRKNSLCKKGRMKMYEIWQ